MRFFIRPVVYVLLLLYGLLLVYISAYYSTIVTRLPELETVFSATNEKHRIQPQAPWNLSQQHDVVKIFICSNAQHLLPTVALINSVFSRSERPETIYFFVALDSPVAALRLRRWLQHALAKPACDRVFVRIIPEEWAAGRLVSRNQRDDLLTSANLGRFFFHRLFSGIRGKVLYLDTDIVVRADISELYSLPIENDTIGRFRVFCSVYRYRSFLNFTHPYIAGLGLREYGCILNAGVFLMDVDEWVRRGITDKVLHLLDLNVKEPIFSNFGIGGFTQPPLLVVTHGLISDLPKEWHVNNLGGAREATINRTEFDRGKLLHWNGKYKPWVFERGTRSAAFRDYWLMFCKPEPRFSEEAASDPFMHMSAQIVAADSLNPPRIEDKHLQEMDYAVMEAWRQEEQRRGFALDCRYPEWWRPES